MSTDSVVQSALRTAVAESVCQTDSVSCYGIYRRYLADISCSGFGLRD